MALVKQILIINIILPFIIFLLLCSTKTFAGQKKTEQLSCYAEYDSEVYINGQLTSTGWSYDALDNKVQFDEANIPSAGQTVRIEYATYGCGSE